MNEDDIVAYLPSSLLGWDRYGANVVLRKENINAEYKTTKDAISKVEKFDGSSGYEYKGNKEKRVQIEEAFYNIFYNNEESMKEYYYDKDTKLETILGDIVKEYMQTNGRLTNTLKKVSEGKYGNIDIVLENNLILFMLNLTSKEVTNGSYVNPSRDEAVMSAKDTGAYYYLSKALKPENVLSMKLSNDMNRNRQTNAIQLYVKYPNFQSKKQITINNPVPSIFQDAEVWSQFRYGRKYNNATKKYVDKDKYYNNGYSYGTFWESACGATAPAVVLSYIFEKEITPLDVRDKIEEYTDSEGNNIKYRENSGTIREVEAKIAELYELDCEHIKYGNNKTENDKKIEKVVKSLLKGTPVVCHTNKGPFGGGHYIVIAGVLKEDIDKLKDKQELDEDDIKTIKTRVKPISDSVLLSKIDALEYDDLKSLSIYVLDPRCKHEYSPNKNSDGTYKAKTMTTAWDIETFSNGGAGKADEFWIYTKTEDTSDIKQEELFNYNKTKYPSDYKEYFDPQYPDDSDKYCNPPKRKDLKLDYYGRKNQSWKNEFDTLFK